MYQTSDTDGKKFWACTDCNYSSKSNHNVFEHIESKHVGSVGYPCSLCDKISPTKNAHRIHNIRHHRK